MTRTVIMAGYGSEKVLYIFEVVFQQTLAIFEILVLWEVFKNSNFANLHDWHVALCVLGFGLCMVEGLHIYKQESIFAFGETRESKVKAHLIAMCIAFVLVSIGIILKIAELSQKGKPHFDNTHGILGLVAWILTGMAAVCGVAATDYYRLPLGLRLRKVIHIILGLAAYLSGIISMGFGIQYLNVGANGDVFLIVILSIFVMYSLTEPCVSLWNLVR